MAKALTEIVAHSPAFATELKKLRHKDSPLLFDRVCAASFPLVIAMVAEELSGRNKAQQVWVICDALPTQERIAAEIPLWSQHQLIFVPEQEVHINNGLSDPDMAAERLHALREISLRPEHTQIIVVTKDSLQDLVPHFKKEEKYSIRLSKDEVYPFDKLMQELKDCDFERVEQVSGRSQWSLRGGILDIFPLQAAHPIRLEFFGDTVESIRAFDLDSQLSFKKLRGVDLVLDEPPADSILADWMGQQDFIIATPDTGVEADVYLFETPPDLPEGASVEMEELQRPDKLAIFATPLGSFETGDFVMQEARRALARQTLLKW